MDKDIRRIWLLTLKGFLFTLTSANDDTQDYLAKRQSSLQLLQGFNGPRSVSINQIQNQASVLKIFFLASKFQTSNERMAIPISELWLHYNDQQSPLRPEHSQKAL